MKLDSDRILLLAFAGVVALTALAAWLAHAAGGLAILATVLAGAASLGSLAATRIYLRRETAARRYAEALLGQARFLRAQRFESIAALAGRIAHDFNNVLTPLLMAVKLLNQDRPQEDRERLLSTAERAVERGADLVKLLLTLAGRIEGERAPLDLGRLVGAVAGQLTNTFPQSIRVEVRLPDHLWPIDGDAAQLTEVLMNLAANSRDAMPAGGTLTLSAENHTLNAEQARLYPDARPGRHVLLTVVDTGGGIPADIADRVFDPYFTTRTSDRGAGLGLATALGIVRAHRGFIDVSSEPGRGTEVSIYLPVAAPAARNDL